MEKFTDGERRTLSEFLNNFSIAWLTTSIIVPMFSEINPSKKMLYLVAGLFVAGLALMGALKLSRGLKI